MKSQGKKKGCYRGDVMNKDPIPPKIDQLRRNQKIVKRQIEFGMAELEKTNESLRNEITRLRHTQEELTLLLRIAQKIGPANDFLSSVDVALSSVCEPTGWVFGEAWVPCSDGTALEWSHAWYGESKSLQRFSELSQDFRFRPGVGLPGRVWASKQPQWVQDISIEPEDKYPRCKIARDFGLKSALGIPIIAGDKVVAVLVFFMSESRQEDQRLVEIVSSAAARLTTVLQHKQSEHALEEQKALLQAIIDDSTSVIWLKDREGRYQLINRECEQLFRISREQVKGKTDYDLFPKHIADDFRANDLSVAEAGAALEFEQSTPQDDGIHTYISSIFPMRDADGKVYAVCGIATDITRRKRAEESLELQVHARTAELLKVNDALQVEIAERAQTEEALRRSEEQLRHTLEFNQAVMANMGEGLYTLDTRGLATYVNPAAERLFGWSNAELLGRKMHDVIHYRRPDGRHFPAEECAGLQVLQAGMVLSNYEDVFIRRDGTFFPVVYSSSPIASDSGIVGLVVVFRDVTAQKQTEDALRRSQEDLRALAARRQAAHEAKRSVLAREIHDELSGSLTALKMDLSLLPDRAAKHHDLFLEKLSSMSGLIDRTLARVHTIVTELRPVVLDKLGLVAAMEWKAREFQERSGIACETHLPVEEISLDRNRATAVFRIFQEALTNVARHANATKVVVDLRTEAGSLILRLCDDGKGIDENVIYAHNAMGLLGMRERALSFGGTAEVSALPERGTCVTVRLPTG
jgi:PAS domain S-box-containing protein